MALTTELRIFPDKELFAIDMAEILDTAVMFSGVIQGCGVTFNQVAGTLTVESGRILIRGRLGVITTSGDVAAPVLTGSANVTCYLVAACNLSTLSQPFTVEIITPSTYEEYQQRKESTADTFNTQDGFDFIVLGTVSVNPTSGKIVNWTPSKDAGQDRTNSKIVNAMAERLTTAERALNTLNSSVTKLNNTVNNLSTHDANQHIYFKIYDFGQRNFDSTGAIDLSANVASYVPANYSLRAALPLMTGTYAAYFYSCYSEGNYVYIKIFKAINHNVKGWPKVLLICTRNL